MNKKYEFMPYFKTKTTVKEVSTVKLLLVEDGSVDLEELKDLPSNIKVIVYRKGSQKPELVELKDVAMIDVGE